jgi:hypothetical protein
MGFNNEVGDLIGETTYYLNKSKTKIISVGFSVARNFKLVVRIAGSKSGNFIIFEEVDWLTFLRHAISMLKLMDSESPIISPTQFGDYELHLVIFNYAKTIKIVQNHDNHIFLARLTLENILRLIDLVKYRFDLLKNLIDKVITESGEGIKIAYDAISPLIYRFNSNVSCILEILQFHPQYFSK